MPEEYNDVELSAFLDEELPAEEMAKIEDELRQSQDLARRLARVRAEKEVGVHSLTEIWRRHRVSCPTREEMGSYLLGVLPPEFQQYIEFHIQRIGCRYCRANLDDLSARQAEAEEQVATRRRKYFDSSAGYLKNP